MGGTSQNSQNFKSYHALEHLMKHHLGYYPIPGRGRVFLTLQVQQPMESKMRLQTQTLSHRPMSTDRNPRMSEFRSSTTSSDQAFALKCLTIRILKMILFTCLLSTVNDTSDLAESCLSWSTSILTLKWRSLFSAPCDIIHTSCLLILPFPSSNRDAATIPPLEWRTSVAAIRNHLTRLPIARVL